MNLSLVEQAIASISHDSLGHGPDSVRLCMADLDAPQFHSHEIRASLSPCERQRARRFADGQQRNRYFASRAFVRCVLGELLNVAPAKLEFEISPTGKPRLCGSPWQRPLWFNLAHAGNVALLGSSVDGEIGVDIEFANVAYDVMPIAAAHFLATETRYLATLPSPEREMAFLKFWTLKEATLKALGTGITRGLGQVEIAIGSDDTLRVGALCAGAVGSISSRTLAIDAMCRPIRTSSGPAIIAVATFDGQGHGAASKHSSDVSRLD